MPGATASVSGRSSIPSDASREPEDKLFASDALQFRLANESLINGMNTDAAFGRDMLRRNPTLSVEQPLESPDSVSHVKLRIGQEARSDGSIDGAGAQAEMIREGKAHGDKP